MPTDLDIQRELIHSMLTRAIESYDAMLAREVYSLSTAGYKIKYSPPLCPTISDDDGLEEIKD